MTDLRGTGDPFVVIDLGEYGEIRIDDDGDHDGFVSQRVDGGAGQLAVKIHEDRNQMSDGEVLDKLSEAEIRVPHGPDGSSESSESSPTSFGRPVAFKCVDCNRTCPRTWRADPNTDRCTECADD